MCSILIFVSLFEFEDINYPHPKRPRIGNKPILGCFGIIIVLLCVIAFLSLKNGNKIRFFSDIGNDRNGNAVNQMDTFHQTLSVED